MTQYGVCSATPAERYSEGRLDDLLQDAETVQRVCYAAAEITIPEGGTVCVEAVFRKPHSFDFFGFYNELVDGYGIMTTGSALTLQNQTARLGYARSGYRSMGKILSLTDRGTLFRCPRRRNITISI